MDLRQDLSRRAAMLPGDETAKLAALLVQYASHFVAIERTLYHRLDAAGRAHFVTWFLKRWGNINSVDPEEWQRYSAIVQASQAEHGRVWLNGSEYVLRDYGQVGYGFSLLGYDWFSGVHDIHFDQYAAPGFDVRPGDVIIDGGAFIGDTAVLFDAKTGGDCTVHAFELLDENLVLMRHNLERNGIGARVQINKMALSERSGEHVSIALTKLQASMSLMYPGEIEVSTISLDDYVREHALPRVDFIKLDIEGAEIPALEGARGTIERFRPRMALCLYHRWDDVMTIPAFLDSLSFRYALQFKWVQLKLGTEAVILLTPPAPVAAAP